MKILVKTIFLFLLVGNSTLKAQDAYNERIDSLLVAISRHIIEDLHNDSIKLTPRSWIGLGDSFELSVVFDSSHNEMITSLNRPNKSSKQTNKRSLKRHFKYRIFMDDTQKNENFPFEMYKYFQYKFLQVRLKDEIPGEALYGEYKFKVGKEGLTILSKKIEILPDVKSISEKCHLEW